MGDMGDCEVVGHLEVDALLRLPEGRCALAVGEQDALCRRAAGGQCGEREQAKEEAEEEAAERCGQHGGTPSDRLRKGATRGERRLSSVGVTEGAKREGRDLANAPCAKPTSVRERACP